MNWISLLHDLHDICLWHPRPDNAEHDRFALLFAALTCSSSPLENQCTSAAEVKVGFGAKNAKAD
jgi:hypothetical protein